MSDNSSISGYYVGITDNWDFVIQQDNPNPDRPFLKIDSEGRLTLPYQPFFNARLSQILENQTGDGRRATLVANDVITDIGKNYNNLTGEFKAPTSGVYHFDCTILARGIINSMINADVKLHIGPREYQATYNPVPIQTFNNDLSFSISNTVYMIAGELAKCSLAVVGSGNTVSIYGDGSTTNSNSFFSGYLVG